MRLTVAFLALMLVFAPSAEAQNSTRQLSANDYARAERFLNASTNQLVFGGSVQPQWMDDGRFWYRNSVPGGAEFIVVDPESGQKERAFDHERMAQALGAAVGANYTALEMPISDLILRERGTGVELEGDRMVRCDLTRYVCRAAPPGDASTGAPGIASPDGSHVAFIREHNLWLRDSETGSETQLTTDGIEDFGYGTNNAGWARRPTPVLKWSPDSRKIATFQHDARGVGMMYLTSTKVGHPELDAWRYPLPEDTVIFRVERVVLDLDRPGGNHVLRMDMEPDQHRSTCSDHIACGGSLGDLEWSEDGSHFVFVSTSRDHKVARVRMGDATTGEVHDIFTEVEETFYESQSGWRYLSASNEILWFSQRDNWGNLFLYDSRTGDLTVPRRPRQRPR